MVGLEAGKDRVTKRFEVSLRRDVDLMGDDPLVRRLVGDDCRRLSHRVGRNVTERNISTGNSQLAHEFTANPRAAARHHGDRACKVVDHELLQSIRTGRCL